jgi:hypothetical protein
MDQGCEKRHGLGGIAKYCFNYMVKNTHRKIGKERIVFWIEAIKLKSMPLKIASVLLGAEQAMKHEIIPAHRRRRLSHSRRSRRSRDHRGERVGSGEGEGERRHKPGEPDAMRQPRTP